MDDWEVLGLRVGASAGEVQSAWRSYARANHPDVGGDAAAFGRGAAAHDRILGLPAGSTGATTTAFHKPTGLGIPVAMVRRRLARRRRPPRVR